MCMNPTEAALGERPALSPEPLAPGALPITRGDAAVERAGHVAEHDWPAQLFIFLNNMGAFALAAGALGMFVWAFFDGDASLLRDWGIAVLMAVGAVLQRVLATRVRDFTRWGWFGALTELAFLTLAKVTVLVGDPLGDGIGAVLGIFIDLLWMSYFWEHRADFGVELDV
jgi:hypothetical protein